MSTVNIELDDKLAALLGEIQQPISRAALELIVWELYRLGRISSGRGAEFLGVSRLDFIQRASDLGIPYLRVTDEDLDREVQTGRTV